jgi:hypothetical protein
VSNDRSYRCYFVSLLAEKSLLANGQVSFGLPTEQASWQEEITNSNTKLSPTAVAHMHTYLTKETLVIVNEHVLGSSSADIPRCANDSFWHIVTETVFYYDKLHLTEKIFKPIVMKQPFMLVAAAGNLAYLKSYGFKTFGDYIDESYDKITDPVERLSAIIRTMKSISSLSVEQKENLSVCLQPIVDFNKNWFFSKEFFNNIVSEYQNNLTTGLEFLRQHRGSCLERWDILRKKDLSKYIITDKEYQELLNMI